MGSAAKSTNTQYKSSNIIEYMRRHSKYHDPNDCNTQFSGSDGIRYAYNAHICANHIKFYADFAHIRAIAIYSMINKKWFLLCSHSIFSVELLSYYISCLSILHICWNAYDRGVDCVDALS